ncbi:DUF4347 domain-containing protein [Acaryochloris marina]|uniref:DUF4347 domain-containing protein n=1 Tax=Acaryochloris marina TaxID=155978 RepID=UPI000303EEBD|nr:DUF4347 domain-containing protein [Acaryochloris marina]BDM78598.1 hypothetical protein AM10699_14670 [Acaryochloris marina MBIC10699]
MTFKKILTGLILSGALESVGYGGALLAKETYPHAQKYQVSAHTLLQTDLEQTSNPLHSARATDVVIIDAGVTNSHALLKNIPSQAAVHYLSPTGDGLEQIGDILSNYRNLKSVHLLAHGSSAQLQLGNSWVNPATLNHRAKQVQSWQAALSPTADIFLYGCHVASTVEGKAFVSDLATLTGADIAASDNLTGDATQGGDWTLEYQLGDLEPHRISQQLALSNYDQVLQVTVLNFNDPTPSLEPATTDVFRFQNVATVGGQSIDALVTVSNINNATLTNLDDNGSFPERFQPVIRHDGGANAISSIRFDFQLVQAGTTTPLAATNVFFSAQDVDGNGSANSVREFVEVINAETVFIDDPTFLELAASLAGGIRHRVINSSNVQSGIGTDDRYEIYSYLGDTVTNFSIVAGNDVGSANCSGASCPRQNSWTFDISDIQVIDFSDAPSTYGVPSHAGTAVTTLRLGTARDGDSGPIPSADALGDDNNGSDDEDGVTLAPLNASDTSYSIQASSLSVTNSTGGPATLHAWVDFDGNGTFDSDEYTSQPVQNGISSPDGALTWSGAGVSGMSGGTTTYARFRITTDGGINANTPGGFARDGEVEDHALAITTPVNPDIDNNFCQVSSDMMFILDKSGSVSLSERRLQRDAVMAMLNYLVDNNITSRVGIVRFDSTSATVIGYTDVTAANLPTFESALNTNYVNIGGGATNWEAGFQQAISLGVSPGSPDVVFFFADGNINSGGSPNDEALQFKQAGAHIYGIGIQSLDIDDFLDITDGSNTTQFDAALDNANSADYVEVNSYDDLADDMTSLLRSLCPPATNNPNVLLVKRITRVNGLTENGGTNLNVYVDDPSYEYDDNTLGSPAPTPLDTEYWPTPSTFLLGATNGGQTRPGDEVEYTIYFLSTGTSTAVGVQFCDKVPSFQTFVPDAFNAVPPAPSGGVGANRGIAVEYNGSLLSFTNDADGDTAQYYPPGSTLPAVCDNAPAQTEDNGAIVVNLGDLPQATGVGTPATSYGAVRFRARVK